MKIIITVHTYYPLKNGIQRVTQYQAEGLAARGHEIHVITSSIPGEKDCETLNGVAIHRVDAHLWHMWNRGNKKAFQRLTVGLSHDSDCLICVAAQAFSAMWLFDVLNEIPCKKILIMHGTQDPRWRSMHFSSPLELLLKMARDFRWKIFYRKNLKYLTRFDLVTHLHEMDYSFQLFKRLGIRNNSVLMNAAEPSFFCPMESVGDGTIVSVGGYCSRKNQLLLLKSYYRSKIKCPLVLIGSADNAYYRKLRKIDGRLSTKNPGRDVRILANISREETIDYIKRACVYVCTSRQEYFPVSIVEAMASSTAWISTDVGIVRYLPGGIIANNSKAISASLELLSEDKNTRIQLAAEGKAFADAYLTETSAIETLERYVEEVCNGISS